MLDEADDLPYPLALLACNQIYVDPVSKAKSLLGLLVHVRAESFPATIEPIFVYFSFTNAKGTIPVRVRLLDAHQRGPALFDFSQDVEGGVGHVHEFLVRAQNVTFHAPGAYRLQAFAGDDLLIERALFVHPVRLQSIATTG
jgi:hypothetical protein